MAKINVRRQDVIWVYVSRFLAIGVNVLLLPLIMKFLSDDELGLWYVFSSISQVVSLFDFGFSSTISRHMTYAWSGADKLKKTSVSNEYRNSTNRALVSEIVVTCRLVYLIVSLAGLFIMAVFGTAYIYSVVDNGVSGNILLSWIVYMVSIFLNMFYGYWASLLQGVGAVAERSKMGVYSKVAQMMIAIALILSGMGLLGFVISYFISGLILRIAGKIYFDKKTSGFERMRKVEIEKVKGCFSVIWGTAWKDGIVALAQYLSTQANTLICAYYIDLSSTSVYGVMTQMVSIIASISASYFNAYQPVFSSVCLRKDAAEQKRIVCVTDFMYKAVFFVGMIALFIVGLPMIHLLRPEMEINALFCLMLCAFYYFFNQKDLFASMISSFNEIPYWQAYVISAIGSLVLSILFVKVFHLGIIGLVAAQLVVNMMYNFWKWPMYMMKRVGIGYLEIYAVGIVYIREKLQHLRTHQR